MNENGWIAYDGNNMGKLFIDVVQGVVDETCPIEDAILSDTVSHMGNIAIRENHLFSEKDTHFRTQHL